MARFCGRRAPALSVAVVPAERSAAPEASSIVNTSPSSTTPHVSSSARSMAMPGMLNSLALRPVGPTSVVVPVTGSIVVSTMGSESSTSGCCAGGTPGGAGWARTPFTAGVPTVPGSWPGTGSVLTVAGFIVSRTRSGTSTDRPRIVPSQAVSVATVRNPVSSLSRLTGTRPPETPSMSSTKTVSKAPGASPDIRATPSSEKVRAVKPMIMPVSLFSESIPTSVAAPVATSIV